MLNPNTAPVVAEIVNLFAKYELPIIARDRIFEEVKLVMDSRIVESVDGPGSILNLDKLWHENAVYQCRSCNKNCNK